MTREQGIRQIDEAQWELMDGSLNLFVQDAQGRRVHAWLTRRPHYCDRGHIQLNIDMPGTVAGIAELDDADSFPRYFFGFEEADRHTRAFLKWRIWKERTAAAASVQAFWDKPELRESMLQVWNTGERAEKMIQGG